jgi:hypothetical protein
MAVKKNNNNNKNEQKKNSGKLTFSRDFTRQRQRSRRDPHGTFRHCCCYRHGDECTSSAETARGKFRNSGRCQVRINIIILYNMYRAHAVNVIIRTDTRARARMIIYIIYYVHSEQMFNSRYRGAADYLVMLYTICNV